jgi:uncharacterized repeat protein (TIGR01451 family)
MTIIALVKAFWRFCSGIVSGAVAVLRFFTGLSDYRGLGCGLGIVFFSITTPSTVLAVQPGTEISNLALATYSLSGHTGIVSTSNTVTITSVVIRTSATLELMKYAPDVAGTETVQVPATESSVIGSGADSFARLPEPILVGNSPQINLGDSLPLVPASLYHKGEPIFLRLTDHDQNLDYSTAESVLIPVSVVGSDEIELLRLSETGLNTGVFIGYIQTSGELPAIAYNGVLTVQEDSEVIVSYEDIADPTDVFSIRIMVDPYGIVFDSVSGLPADGISLTLTNSDTGLPATVFGDDGVSRFPSTIITGGTTQDSSGRTYDFPSGAYRYPYIFPGSYRLEVQTSADYIAPSIVSTPDLQNLPTGPFVIVEPGSRGEIFVVTPGPAIHIDIPVDPIRNTLWVQKSVNREIAAIGDFLQYSLIVESTDIDVLNQVGVTDALPLGFRFQEGSLMIDGVKTADPDISSDGRTLSFSIGNLDPSETVNIRYVVAIAAGAKLGNATNRASAHSGRGIRSNLASATVLVREDLFRNSSFIMGQVILNDDSSNAVDVPQGVKGIRIYLEDGTYTVTDENGMYHFEGVRPGVHVVQLDLDSVPEKYQVKAHEKNSRFSGRSYSQFVDVQGGTMWRTDFYIAEKPPLAGGVALSLKTVLYDEDTVEYKVQIQITDVPLDKLRLTMMLPEQFEYVKGSSRLDDQSFEDPSVRSGILIYRMGDVPAGWTKELTFRSDTQFPEKSLESITKCLLVFNAAEQKNQRTAVVENILTLKVEDHGETLDQKETASKTITLDKFEDSTRMVTKGKWQDDNKEKIVVSSSADKAVPGYKESAWIEQAKPGLDWLWPEPGYGPSIPSLKIYIKHNPDQVLTLQLNGTEVNKLNFDGTQKNRKKTVAVSSWSGVDLIEGDNRLEVVSKNRDGKENGRLKRMVHYSSPPVHAELVPEKSTLIADGITAPVIAIRLTDQDGFPARTGIVGEYTIESSHSAYERKDNFENLPLAEEKEEKPHYRVTEDGLAYIKLQPVTDSGEAVVHFPFMKEDQPIRAWLQPGNRDWIIVGLAEGTAGYNTVSGHMENLNDSDISDDYHQDGRVAFFAKGKVKGEWLLTLSYDSERKQTGTGNGLFQEVDPDSYYTLYGDGSEQKYNAASARKLYLKIERGQFYALFGDFTTDLTVTELSRYNRSLNGLKTEMKTKNYGFNFFASDTGQTFMKDEIRGDGTSGLYRLSRKPIVLNSEKIEIQIRNRFRSEEIVSTDSLTRHVDYNIDYDAGTIFFKEPVFSKDENLNPIFIVVDYEYGDAVGSDAQTYGGRGNVSLFNQKLNLGVTLIHEDQVGEKGNLEGLDASYELTKNTKIKTEIAATQNENFDEKSDGNAFIAEIIHSTDKIDGKVYAREQGEGFGLGQQNGSESATRKIGVDMSYRYNSNVDFDGEMYRNYNLATDAERDLFETGAKYKAESYNLKSGVRHAEDRMGDGSVNRSDQVFMGASKQFLEKKLKLRLDHDQSVGSNNENSDFPTRTTLGADYRVIDPITLFAEQEFTFGENEDTSGTRIGVKATPWTGGNLNSSVEQQHREDGRRVFANMGLKQTFQLTPKWRLDGGLDQSRTIKHPGNDSINTDVPPASGTNNDDFSAISFGAHFQEKKWSWNGRIETRFADTEDKWGLLSGVYGEPAKNVGMSAGVQVFRTEAQAGAEKTDADLRLGFAYRPISTKWILLDRLDFILEENKDDNSDITSSRIVNNFNANYKPKHDLQISFQYGAKYVKDNFDEADYKGYTDLLGMETRYDVNEKWDIGVHGSFLNSWSAGQRDYRTGLSAGYNIVKNAWFSVGYNFTGFSDRDFSKANYTAKGPFMRFRIKFDQETMRDALKML